MIDRMSGRVALLLVSVALILVALARLVRARSRRSGRRRRSSTRRSARRTFSWQAVTSLLQGPVGRRASRRCRSAKIAVPDDPKMSQILRQLSACGVHRRCRARRRSHRRPLVPLAGAEAVPMTLNVKGHYFAIQRFLRDAPERGRAARRQGASRPAGSTPSTASSSPALAHRQPRPGQSSGGSTVWSRQRWRSTPSSTPRRPCRQRRRRPPTRRPRRRHAADALMSVGRRLIASRRTAYAAAAAAKQRRQKIIAGGARCRPARRARVRGSAPAEDRLRRQQARRSDGRHDARRRRSLRRARPGCCRRFGATPAGDPFAAAGRRRTAIRRPATSPVPAGSVDPFAAQVVVGIVARQPTAAAGHRGSPLPEKIVIGTPGGGRQREPRLDRHPRVDPDRARARLRNELRRQGAEPRAEPGLRAQLVEPPAAARRLLGRLHRAVRDAERGHELAPAASIRRAIRPPTSAS